MKKILGVSLVALFAVSPMMANATQSAASVNTTLAGLADTQTTATADAQAIATAAYVKGAYNSAASAINTAAGAINNIVTDIDVTAQQQTNAVALDVNGNKVLQAGSSVAENLSNIDAKIGTFTNTENGLITNTDSVGANLHALESAILGQTSNIGTISNGSAVLSDGSYMINANSNVATNLGNIDTKIGTISNDTNKLIKNVNSVSANLDALNTQVQANQGNIGDVTSFTQAAGFDANTEDVSSAVVQAMAAAAAAKDAADAAADAADANTIVVYSGWNNGGVPNQAAKYTTMTDSDATTAVNAANGTSGT